jgi:adenylate kinase family enzyme
MKVAILGYSGSGKSTLAKHIATTQQIPCLHLDTVQFIENWQTRPDEEAKALVKEFSAGANWVIDGNYTRYYQAERLEKADQIVLLLFPRWHALRRVVTRYFNYRGKTRPDMAEGCEEKIDWEFLWWVLYQGRTRAIRQHYQEIKDAYPDKTIIVRNQSELEKLYQQYH